MMKDPISTTDSADPDDLNALTLDQHQLNIGDSLQLQVENKCYFATLIGYLKGQSFIVTTPDEMEAVIGTDEGPSLVVRFFSNKRAYLFNTVVHRAMSEPFPHLHLTYPKEVRVLKERQYDRTSVNIAGTADAHDGQSFSCVVRDISIGGALIALQGQTGALNDPLVLTLKMDINGVEYELNLDSAICSVRVAESQNDDNALVLQGVAFNDLSEHEVLALSAFDLLPNWKGSA